MGVALDKLRGKIDNAIVKYCNDYSLRLSHSRKDEKLFRDPIFGFQRIKPHEVLIIDTPLFQRLRGIFQTSLAYLTYPSSIHTRFEHSVNTLHLASRILDELKSRGISINEDEILEVRLAALLHDIGHCIFSHGSEYFYCQLPEICDTFDDAEFSVAFPSAGEIINYCIITSEKFNQLVWQPILNEFKSPKNPVTKIKLKRVAQMIIGMAPDDNPQQRYLTDIINGPIDVDKLDYLSRDGYFTGVSFSVDIDRLLPSLRVVQVNNSERKREEYRLVVDHRGIAVVEQLLFARMLLYDTVYHHHKVRAANCLLQNILSKYSNQCYWPTTTGQLKSIGDFLEIDEYEFFGNRYEEASINADIEKLRRRILPHRALVIMPRALCDKQSHTTWAIQCDKAAKRDDPQASMEGKEFFNKIKELTVRYANDAGGDDIKIDDISIDIPELPKYDDLGRDTLIQVADNYCVRLEDFFPFQKAVNNYTTQYKYRTYVFSSEENTEFVAYAAYRAFEDMGIKLNNLSLLLAHKQKDTERYFAKFSIDPRDWQTNYYVPSESSPS